MRLNLSPENLTRAICVLMALVLASMMAPVAVLAAPAAPSGLTATVDSATEVELEWTSNSGGAEDGFHIQRATDAGFTQNVVTFTTEEEETDYDDEAAPPGTTLFYRVTAFDGTGDSAPSNPVSVTTPAPPTAPTVLTATRFNDNRVDLAWTDNSNNEQGFHIETSTRANFTPSITMTVAAGVVTYQDNTVAATGDTFYYRVTAYSGLADSAPSNVASVYIPAAVAGPPQAPSGLNAVAAGATQVDVTWGDNSTNETGFMVERCVDGTFTAGVVLNVVAPNTTTFSDTTVQSGVTYYYRVRAWNVLGESANSGAVPATPGGMPVRASGGGGGGGGGGGFGPAPSTPGPGVTSLATIVDGRGSFAQPTKVASQNGKLNLDIKSGTIGKTKDGAPLGEISVLQMLAPPVAPPAGNTVVSLTYELGPAGATFDPPIGLSLGYSSLPAGADPADLQIFYWDAVAGKWIGLDTTPGPNNTVTTKIWHFTPFTVLSKPKPQPPAGVTATPVGSSQVDVKWQDNSEVETGYRVERSTDPTFAKDVTKVDEPANSVAYADKDINPGVTYYYRVTAIGSASAPPSTVVSIKTALPTCTEALKPIADKLVVVWGFDADKKAFTVYDPKASTMVNDLKELKKGEGYYIKVSAPTKLVHGGNTYDLKAGFNLIGWLG